jgi:hypothetical protein
MLSGDATNTNSTVFGLTQPGLQFTIYRTRLEHTNHYTTNEDFLGPGVFKNVVQTINTLTLILWLEKSVKPA